METINNSKQIQHIASNKANENKLQLNNHRIQSDTSQRNYKQLV